MYIKQPRLRRHELIGILGFYTAEQLKNLADNVKEKNFLVTAVEITVNLDFRSSFKSKNNGEKLLPRSLVMKLFEATSWFC